MYSTWLAMSLIRLAKVPEPDVGFESRTRMRKPSEFSWMYRSSCDRGHLELGHGVLALEQRGRHRQEPLDLAVHDDGVQAFLAAEVLVHDRLGHAGLGGDLLDGGAVQAALGEQSPTDVQELLSALFAGHALTAVAGGRIRHRSIMVA